MNVQVGVSVIIPTYNRSRYVSKAIDSVLAQTYANYEIIVVDDGSTDNTKSVLDPYQDIIRYFHQENAGVSATRNLGIKESKSEWIAFLDSDDEWLPKKLEEQVNFINKHPEVVLHAVNLDISCYRSNGTTSFDHCRFKPCDETIYIKEPFPFHLKYRTTVMPPSVVCRRDMAMKVGGFVEGRSLFEDYEFMCKMATQGPWGITNKVLAKAFMRDENMANLSDCRSNSIIKYKTLIEVYQSLLCSGLLWVKEKNTIRKLLCGYYRAYGKILAAANGDMKEPRKAFWNACQTQIGIKNVVFYLMSYLPAPVLNSLEKCNSKIQQRFSRTNVL